MTMCPTWKMQQIYANIVRGKVGCWFSRGGCLKSGRSLYDDYTLIGYPPYQKTSILCPSTILPYWHHFQFLLLLRPSAQNHIELTNNRLAKKLQVYCTKIKLPPPSPETKNAGPCPNILEMLRWQSGGPTKFYHSKGCQSPEYRLASRAHQPHVVEPTANAWLNATNMAPMERGWVEVRRAHGEGHHSSSRHSHQSVVGTTPLGQL